MNPEFEEALQQRANNSQDIITLNQMKSKIEFSKKLMIFFIIIDLFVILFTCAMVILTLDVSPLIYLIPAVAAEVASATAFYYQKSKVENRIKLMAAYNVMPTNDDFRDY